MTLSPGPSLPAPFPRNSLNCSGPWSPAEPYSRSSCHSPCPERRGPTIIFHFREENIKGKGGCSK